MQILVLKVQLETLLNLEIKEQLVQKALMEQVTLLDLLDKMDNLEYQVMLGSLDSKAQRVPVEI